MHCWPTLHMATHAAAMGISALAYLFARQQRPQFPFYLRTGNSATLPLFQCEFILA